MYSRAWSDNAQPNVNAKSFHDPQPEVVEFTLAKHVFEIENKTFIILLKENDRGRFLRIVETSGEFRQSLVIPASGLNDFKAIFDFMVEADQEFLPAMNATEGARR